jgi:predicted dehydrogenase
LPVLMRTGVEVLGLADPDVHAMSVTMRLAGLDRSVSLATRLEPEWLKALKPDFVIIASPSGYHFRQAQICLSLGFDVFLEKPIATSAGDAVALAILSHAGRNVVVSEQRPFRSDVVWVKRYLASGALGELKRMRYSDSIRPAPLFRESWRNDPRLAGGGVLMDLGYHALHLLVHIVEPLGSKLKIIGAQMRSGDLRVERFARLRLTSGSVEVMLRVAVDTGVSAERLELAGATGNLVVTRLRAGDRPFRIHFRKGTGRWHERILPPDRRFDSVALEDFVSGANARERLAPHVRTATLIEEAYRRARF